MLSDIERHRKWRERHPNEAKRRRYYYDGRSFIKHTRDSKRLNDLVLYAQNRLSKLKGSEQS